MCLPVCVCVCRVLDGAESMCVVRALIDSWGQVGSVSLGHNESSSGVSLLDAAQHECLLQCLRCWQRLCAADTDTDSHQVLQSQFAVAL